MTEQELERVAFLMAAKNKRLSKDKPVDGRLKEARAAKALAELTAFEKAQAELEAHDE